MTTRRTFLHRLPGHGFAPPAADVAALGCAVPGGDADRRFTELVAGFAAEFWALSPDARGAGWDALAADVVGPAAARLMELRPGLAVVPVPQPGPSSAELANLLQELFTLPPRARAARRADWLAARATDLPHWAAAARVVLRTDRPLAVLEPQLFDWLATGAPPAPTPTWEWELHRGRGRWRDRVTSWLGTGAGVFFLWLMGYFVYQMVVYPVAPTRPSPPAAPPVKTPRLMGREPRTFVEYAQRGRTGPVPARWGEWRLAGQPQPGGTP